MRHGRNNGHRWLERFLLFGGIAAILVAAWFLAGAELWRKWEDRKFDAAQQQAAQETLKEQPEAPAAPVEPPAPGEVIGRLSIPRLDVKSVVREGASDGVLSLALGHIAGTALPGEVGNVGVAGHRDTLFRGLRNVALNDEIVLETTEKKYVYQVERTQIVMPTDVEVLNPTPQESELTLVTCYPFNYIGSAPKRFIVKAKLVPEAIEARATVPAPVSTPAPKPVAVAKPAARPAPSPVVKPVAYQAPKPKPYQEMPRPGRVSFSVTSGHSRELLANQVWFGLSRGEDDRADGWLWIAPERRTVWVRDAEEGRPISFRNNGRNYELVITKRTATGVNGYIVPGRS